MLENFRSANADALKAYEGDLAARYARLKLAGLEEAPRQLAIFADPATPAGHGLGRRTMPEMAEYSVVAAIVTLWLAARAEGIGMGWVSILTPAGINALLDVPQTGGWSATSASAIPQGEDIAPELERAGWEQRRDASAFVLRR